MVLIHVHGTLTCSNLDGALTWLHHREDLGEALTILNIEERKRASEAFQIIKLSNKIYQGLTRAILSDGSLKGKRFQTW